MRNKNYNPYGYCGREGYDRFNRALRPWYNAPVRVVTDFFKNLIIMLVACFGAVLTVLTAIGMVLIYIAIVSLPILCAIAAIKYLFF